MANIDAILDEQVSYGFEGGPEYDTGEVPLENGMSVRQANWKYPRHKYTASFDNVDDDVRDYLIEVFHACRGKLHTFKFKDWNDYTADHEQIQVSTDMSAVQLYKVYQFGQAYTVRPIQAISPDGFQIVDNTGAVVAGTLDDDTGMFLPAAPWDSGKTYYWTGHFYVWVHFTDDYNGMTIKNWRNHSASVDLEEDKKKITATNVPPSWDQ